MFQMDLVENRRAYRLVLVRPCDRKILMTAGSGGPHLLQVEVKRWARQAAELQKSIHELWGLNCILLEILGEGTNGIPYAIGEIVSECEVKSLTFATLAEIPDAVLPRSDRDRLDAFVAGSSSLVGPLSRLGWMDHARRWIEENIPDRPPSLAVEVRQLNAGGGFVLMRFRTCAGRFYWLKATGMPNLHEYGVTSMLSVCLPHFLPPIVSMRREWNAWLMEDGGTPLRRCFSLPAWECAVIKLASLQQESIQHIQALLDSGCHNQCLPVLFDHLVEMIDYLEAAMAQPISTDAPRLERSQFKTLQCALRTACQSRAALGIPETLIHGDINPGNILFKDGRCVFIDWAEASIGDPLVTFEHLMIHLGKVSNVTASWVPHLRKIYKRQWLDRLSVAAIDRAFTLTPLLAIATNLFGRGDWLRSSLRWESAFQKHARTLARQMFRAAQRSGLGGASR